MKELFKTIIKDFQEEAVFVEKDKKIQLIPCWKWLLEQ